MAICIKKSGVRSNTKQGTSFLKLTLGDIYESEVGNCVTMATLTLQNKSDAHFLIIKTKKEVRNEIKL